VSACAALTETASLGVAPALRAVDCLANNAAAGAFGRLFGTQGALLPALTILLTLYIAFFAISLLTGRSRIGVSALTPRMLTLGLVLTFATSWVAWQGVVWNLAVGAPDQIASILMGAPGSATQLFADRLDIVFAAIRQTAELAGGAAPAAGKDDSAFTPGNLMWIGTLLLLLGTVGVLVTARIALAVLLATGPIFVVMALFGGTRGLFVGWLRGLVMVALAPLFVIVGGGMMLELIVPVIAGLAADGQISGQSAIALFLVACVHAALMMMVMKVTATIVSGWQVFGLATDSRTDRASAPASVSVADAGAVAAVASGASSARSRSGAMAAAMQPVVVEAAQSRATHSTSRTVVDRTGPMAAAGLPPIARTRARGIGSRFRAPQPRIREMLR